MRDTGPLNRISAERSKQAPDGRGHAAAPERLQKILSAHGDWSRREADVMIRDGRVSVNGTTAEIGQSAVYGSDEIMVDKVPLKPDDGLHYIMLNKPRGYVTTMRDDKGRLTVKDLVSGVGARVYPVGRLDYDSSGLLLMTNDGQFANTVAHPSNGYIKTYETRVRGDVSGIEEKLRRPMEIDSHIVKAVSARLISMTAGGGLLRISINEGRNRQIRKMLAKCGLDVVSLKRVSVGALKLGPLKTGNWRRLTEAEVDMFRVRCKK